MPRDVREEIASEQDVFLQRLGGAAAPAGFDALRVEIAGRALARKRGRSAAKAWPRLAEALGGAFAERFAAYCSERQWPPAGGAMADGWLFAQWLEGRGELSDEGAIERAAVRLRMAWREREQGLIVRRAPSVVVASIGSRKRWIAAIRIGGWEWWWRTRSGQGAAAAGPDRGRSALGV